MRRRVPRRSLLALFASGLLAALSLLLWHDLRGVDENEGAAQVQRRVELAAEELQLAIQVHAYALESLARDWDRRREPLVDDFNQAAGLYAERFPEVRALEWVDAGGFVRWVAPLGGNQSAEGLDLGFEAGRRGAMERARATGAAVASPVVNLVQGGRGLLIFVPLDRQDPWGGFLLGVYGVERVLERVLRSQFDLPLSISKAGQQLHGTAPDPARPSLAATEVELLGETWRISSPALSAGGAAGAAAVVLFIGLIVSAIVGVALYQLGRTRRPLEATSDALGSSPGVRLVGGFLALALFAAAISSISASRLEGRVSELGRLESPLLFDLQQLEASFTSAVQEGFAYLLSGKAVELDEHVQNRRDFDLAIERVAASLRDAPREVARLERIQGAQGGLWAAFDEAFAGRGEGGGVAEESFLAIEGRVDVISTDLRDLVAGQHAQVAASFAGVAGLAGSSRFLIHAVGFVTALVAILIGLLTASLVARNVAARLRAERALAEERGLEAERVASQLQEARDQLERRTRLAAIGQVSAGIAHDLRNPLGAIRNSAFFLRRKLGERADEKVLQHLSIIEQEVRDSDAIIAHLMSLAQERPPAKQRVDLREIAEAALARARLPAGMTCTLDLQPDPFLVQVDVVLLRQLLENLLRNALEAVGGRGRIEVRARRRGELDEILVSDDGPGIPAEDRERLFAPLFTSKEQGMGIGLTICRQIAEAHGGTLEAAEPEAGGAGARLRILLPSPTRELTTTEVRA